MTYIFLSKHCFFHLQLLIYWLASFVSSLLSGNVCGHYITYVVLCFKEDKYRGGVSMQRILIFTGCLVAVGLIEWVISIYSQVLSGRGLQSISTPPSQVCSTHLPRGKVRTLFKLFNKSNFLIMNEAFILHEQSYCWLSSRLLQ